MFPLFSPISLAASLFHLSCFTAESSPTLLQPHVLQPARLLCPWDFPGKNTGVGCHALLQGIFPTQGSNPRLLHCRWILYRWATRDAPSSFLNRLYLLLLRVSTPWTTRPVAGLITGTCHLGPTSLTKFNWCAGKYGHTVLLSVLDICCYNKLLHLRHIF